MSTSQGRLSAAELAKPAKLDTPSKVVAGAQSKIDALVDAVKALCAKLDVDTGVNSINYASTISDALSKLDIEL